MYLDKGLLRVLAFMTVLTVPTSVLGQNTGACCLPQVPSCTEATEAACTGRYEGDQTECTPNPCEMACCDVAANTCSLQIPEDCAATGGISNVRSISRDIN